MFRLKPAAEQHLLYFPAVAACRLHNEKA